MPFPDRGSGTKKPWKVPRIWSGGTVFILGSGPSLKDIEGKDYLNNKNVIAVNDAHAVNEKCVDILFFGDSISYWNSQVRTETHVSSLSCLKVSLNIHCEVGNKRRSLEGIKDINIINESKKVLGISKKRTELCWNKFSGGAAINLAVHLGAKQIVLIGYDMRKYNNMLYWDKEAYGKEIINRADSSVRYRNKRTWLIIQKDLKDLGVLIYNASRFCKNKVIPRRDLEDFI